MHEVEEPCGETGTLISPESRNVTPRRSLCASLLASPNTTLMLVSIAIFLDTTFAGLMMPFLPQMMHNWGVPRIYIGAMYASFSAAAGIGSICAAAVLKTGRKCQRALVLSLVCFAGATSVFAVSTSYTAFLVARIAQGGCSALTWTAGLSLCGLAFENHQQGRAFANVMMAANLGVLTGPAIGGGLFTLSGNKSVVFAAPAGLLLLLIPGVLALPPPNDEASEHSVRLSISAQATLLAKEPLFVLLALANVVLAMTSWSLEPVFGIWMEESFNSKPLEISLIWSCFPLALSVATPFVGCFVDSHSDKRSHTVIFGFMCIAAGSVLVSQVSSRGRLVGALVLLGCGQAIGEGPTVPQLNAIADQVGRVDPGIVPAVVTFCMNLGGFLGPMLVTTVVHLESFPAACVALGLVAGMFICVFALLPLLWPSKPKVSPFYQEYGAVPGSPCPSSRSQ